ncbi:MAG: aspartate aminotransferase family protein, partial [bacterium]|nr:aspartate aminotransferase family protein [bacterium]
MNLTALSDRFLRKLPPRITNALFGGARKIPKVRRMLEAEYEEMLGDAPLEPPQGDHPVFDRIPAEPMIHDEILRTLAALADNEREDWSEGRASGAVYHGDEDHIEFLNQVYSLHSQSNPLHVDVWPSGMKFEAEIVAMTAGMLGAGRTAD